ncbi:hypothetical protein [Lihuaxuella thermophila]|uniref:Uncharacterized protein n=1 Tax=Lihuaxuella thermophila TaxID=1173111 RepID=A0A1H8E705_9BACL|nr:hypothetical protein [Lihuaxuella thermophila]SEN15200.1 hypothetical protein SAMN05444955_106162 [Lihuaxuella thermophila]
MKKTWLTAKEISQFGYCPEQWRLTRLNKHRPVEVDQEKQASKLTRLKAGRDYHMNIQVKPPLHRWIAIAVGLCLILLLVLLWTVIK